MQMGETVCASEREHLMVEDAQELVLAHPGADCLCEVVQRGLADRRRVLRDLVRGLDDTCCFHRVVGINESHAESLERRETVVIHAIHTEPGVAHAPGPHLRLNLAKPILAGPFEVYTSL